MIIRGHRAAVPCSRSDPSGATWRYSVCRVMPSSLQRGAISVSGLPIAAWARRSFAGVILNGAPPLRPRARAAAMPAFVCSTDSPDLGGGLLPRDGLWAGVPGPRPLPFR